MCNEIDIGFAVFIEFYWVLLGFIEFYWDLLGFTEFYRVLLDFIRCSPLVDEVMLCATKLI